MERVQYSLEASLPELKDLQANGIFSPEEVKEIIKRRTNFELQLIRRQPRKKDFLDYIEYEMALERLRRKRVARLETPLPHSLSSHSLVQKQFSIFERATRKFKGDIRLWVQYIDVAKKEGAGNLVGRVVAKALKLHPSSVPLYILAAQHELNQSSPSAARNLLQRGIRLNNESVDLWCEYAKMELGWCEFLKRRWETLGIQVVEGDPEVSLSTNQPEAEAARKEVLNGAIVKEVLKNALQTLPSLNTFNSLLQTLQSYPTHLSKTLMNFLFDLLIQAGNLKNTNPAQIRAIHNTRHLSGVSDGPDFVKGLKLANEELVTTCLNLYNEGSDGSSSQEEDTLAAYANFVIQQWEAVSEENLRLYLSSSLYNVCNTVLKNALSPGKTQGPGRDAVFSTHLRILLDPTHPQPLPTWKRILKLSRQYSVASKDPGVWIRRLGAEQRGSSEIASSPPEALREVSGLARSRCQGDGIESIWTWGWDGLNASQREVGVLTNSSDVAEAGDRPQQALLKESVALPLNSQMMQLRETLFLRTLSALYQGISTSGLHQPGTLQETTVTGRLKTLTRLLECYLPTPEIYRHAFELERALPAPANPKAPQAGQASSRILKEIYLQWRHRSESSREDATFAYAAYLLDSGSVGEAMALVNNLIATSPSGEFREKIERRWKAILEGGALNNEDEATMEVDDTADPDEDAGQTSDDESASDVEFVVVG